MVGPALSLRGSDLVGSGYYRQLRSRSTDRYTTDVRLQDQRIRPRAGILRNVELRVGSPLGASVDLEWTKTIDDPTITWTNISRHKRHG